MSDEESFAGLKEFLQPMVSRYARDNKVAPHVDAAIGGLTAGDRAATDHALRELYKSGRRLRDEDRERVLISLRTLNSSAAERESRPERPAGSRRHDMPAWTMYFMTILGAGLLAIGWRTGELRPLILGGAALCFGLLSLAHRWREWRTH